MWEYPEEQDSWQKNFQSNEDIKWFVKHFNTDHNIIERIHGMSS